jgi:hypothetical protein
VLFDGTALVAVHDHVFRYEVSPHFGDGRALSKGEAVFGYEEHLKAILGSDREPVSLN